MESCRVEANIGISFASRARLLHISEMTSSKFDAVVRTVEAIAD